MDFHVFQFKWPAAAARFAFASKNRGRNYVLCPATGSAGQGSRQPPPVTCPSPALVTPNIFVTSLPTYWSWGIPVIAECVSCQQQPWTAYHTLTNSQHWADAELCKVPIYLGFAKHMSQILNNLFQDNVVCVCFAYALVKIKIFYWNRNFTYCFCF